MLKKMKFKTELKQIMDIIINSLYSSKDIFLRELISNSSDAIDTLRYESLTRPELLEDGSEWEIKIIPDQDKGTLTVSDNGIGMSREEIAANLGTIARSGTKEFLERFRKAEKKDLPELIGQFGVGFYSSFMVAEKVVVLSRTAEDKAGGVKWESTGQGEFTVEDVEKATRGTEVIIHLHEEDKEFLQEWRIKEIVRKFSDFIEHPIVLEVKQKEEGKEEKKLSTEVLNRRKAIWLRPQSEVTEEEYREFYKHISRDHEDPLESIHFAAEGTLEFRAILFIPAHMPFGLLWWQQSKSGLQLYVRRVFITDDFEKLLPGYLRFVRGVVDSSDLPLNVSREMLQENPLVGKIQKSLVTKILNTLGEMKSGRREKYESFYKEFGSIIKEGVSQDWANREKLADLLLFQSTKTEPGKQVSLAEYVERIASGQEEIYYLIGDSRRELEHSPYLEIFKDRQIEVLLLTDPIDNWVMDGLSEYKGKKLKAVDKGDLKGVAEDKEADREEEEKFKPFLEFLKEKIAGVKGVRLSRRLRESAACLVVEESEMGSYMERMVKKLGQDKDFAGSDRILELNLAHPAVKALKDLFEKNRGDERIVECGLLLYEEAVVAEGSKVADSAAFSRRINDLIVKNLSI